MSMIIDGMDQAPLKLPYHGTQSTFGDEALQAHITGVKEHPNRVVLYRTVETVSKSGDLVVYCILKQLESWKDRNNGRYPKKVYIQVSVINSYTLLD